MMKERTPSIRKTKEEILHLIQECQNKQCEQAQQDIVLYYTNLVHSLAYRYSKGNASHEDFVQVGMLGLLGAIRRYDTSLKKEFEAFLIPTIMGEMKKYLRDKTWDVHVPRRIKDKSSTLKKTIEILTSTLQRSPQIQEIATHMKLSEEEVLELMEAKQHYQTTSLDAEIETTSERAIGAKIEFVGVEEEGYRKVDQYLTLDKLLPLLTKQEKEILYYTFIKQHNQKDTGNLLGISQMHVSRIQRRALQKLRKASDSKIEM
ncbi:RNA polymerase sigma factor SigB [Bacillus cereus]|uniref:RNA polymerase sigma factor SigB n=1 Tax=Bacillus cereus TaxID=1396 RepID=UPI0028528983|nr:RNA polymerase sigma factor SigB [Bacillus cereus]